MATEDDLFQGFMDGQEQLEGGDVDAAIASWEAVARGFEALGVDAVEDGYQVLPYAGVLTNLASLAQAVGDYAAMRAHAARLLQLGESAQALRLAATAAKHVEGDGPALALLERALAVDPHHVASLHERACTDLQRRVVLALIDCEALWFAIPFLNALAPFRIPNVTPSLARRELWL